MLRQLGIVIVAGVLSTTCYAQSSPKGEARYIALNGRCGPEYILEDAPAYFGNPKTTTQILDVIRILRSAPARADVQCWDFNDAWAPYLFADRKIQIASLLMTLKRYDEARDELWSLFLGEEVLYGQRKLYYDMGTNKAISLLMSDRLWSVADIERRLKDPRYRHSERIKKAYERRRGLASSR